MILNELFSAIQQLAVFTLIPFIVYLIQKRSVKGFGRYLGLYSSPSQANLLAALASLLVVISTVGIIFVSDEMREVMFNPPSITGKFRAMGFSKNAMVIVMIIAWIKTATAEEILFRGFIGKRLMNWLGYQTGNIVQSVIFALLHVVIFIIIQSSIFFLVFIFLMSGLGAYISGYLNEKRAGGSIVPGIISHGLGNTLAYSIVGFLM